MAKTKTIYSCQNCGAQRPRWEGKCSDCGSWNSFVEEVSIANDKQRGWSLGGTSGVSDTKTIRLDAEVLAPNLARHSTHFAELDRVLGGGLVQGSFVLLGGAPGIGKSTIIMQMAGGLAKDNIQVLYVSGEESTAQTASRAQRLGVRSSQIEIASESNLNVILELAKNRHPSVLVLDSIQTVYIPELNSAPGTVTQVRECAGHLMGLAKRENISVILIGHITKDGNIAGPKVLEHMVDCVLTFEGDMNHQFRLLRSIKNRFGAANELGVFRMNAQGLQEVANPSEMFLEERGTNRIGSVIFASMEGTRPLLCEVQALTISTQMAMARRTSIGIDVNRLHLLGAVLDRHLNINLTQSDLFVNVVGGLQIDEPAADLAMLAAMLSTEGRIEIDPKTIFFGEVGLTGELRAVPFAENRIREGVKLGFTNFILPNSNKRHLDEIPPNINLVWLKTIAELPRALRK